MEQLRKLNKNRSWLKEEDDKLRRQINPETKPNWKSVASKLGLKRTANSCRQRWINHLRPCTRPGKLTCEEKLLTLEFRSEAGKNCWSEIAKKLLPGRTDNDLKNFWHTLAKKADREGRDANSDAILKSAELVETIKASGRFTMDYSSLISSDAYDLLNRLLPGLGVAGGGAATEASDSSSIICDGAVASVGCGIDVSCNDLASSSAATDIGTTDAITSVDLGPSRVGYSEFSYIVPTGADQLMPLEQECDETPQSYVAVQQQLQKGFTTGFFDYGGGPVSAPGSEPVSGAESGSTVTGNPYSGAPQFHATVEQHQQLVNSVSFVHGGGPSAFNQMPAAKWGHSSSKIDNPYSIATQIHVPVQPQQLVKSGLFHHGGGSTGFNQVPAAALGSTSTEASKQGLSHMQVSSPASDYVHNAFVNAPQFHVPVEQHEQLAFNSGFFDHGGGPIGFNKATYGGGSIGQYYF